MTAPADPAVIAPADPADGPPRFRWRLFPAAGCGLAALYSGLLAASTAAMLFHFAGSPFPGSRELWPWATAMLLHRTAMTLAWGVAVPFFWRGQWTWAWIAVAAAILFPLASTLLVSRLMPY
ncbi:hypothetical protein [Alienimonas californiensis]|uniref:Uncharacterized protein n=1 Tax=Alienimonas californiensis TaxID=2527989 RepID=A0A517P8J4_9PLAN|nr:hypothetical protein [Alienimonas californiensis]QDT15687.1 hypothetical protein CA12_17770 [Alienimonas californiensis]